MKLHHRAIGWSAAFTRVLGCTQRAVKSRVGLAAAGLLIGAMCAHATPSEARMAAATVPFVANEGQLADASVKFFADTFGGTVYVKADGTIVYSLPKIEQADAQDDQSTTSRCAGIGTIREKLVGARAAAVSGKEKSETVVNSFVGNDRKSWRSNISSFTSVGLGEVYDRIELELKAHGNNVEKIFTVRPGGDPGMIRLTQEGADTLAIDESGCLVAAVTGLGDARFSAPIAYQEIDGKRVDVEVRYALNASARTYGFEVGAYDKAHDLVIDPVLASTFVGVTVGGGVSFTYSMALDAQTNVYLASHVAGPIALGEVPGFMTNQLGARDGSIMKFSRDLDRLLSATYIGGDNWDLASSIAVVGTNVYVSGHTSSTNFPIVNGCYPDYFEVELRLAAHCLHLCGRLQCRVYQ